MRSKLHLSMDRTGIMDDPDFDPDRVDLRTLALHFWRRRNVAIGATLAGTVLAFALSAMITPRYLARASVMLDSRSVQVLSTDNVVSDLTLNNPLLDSEAAVLRSNLLLERVINSFGPDELDPIDPAATPPSWAGRLIGLLTPSIAAPEDPATAMSEEDKRMRRLVNALRQRISVSREGTSYVISISVETEAPALSTRIANTLVTEYIAGQIADRTKAVSGATDFLSDRVTEMRQTVEKAEDAVEEFKIAQLGVDGISLDTMSQQMLDLSAQLAVARADLASIQAKSSQLDSVIASSGVEAAAEFLSAPLILSLQDRLEEFMQRDRDLAELDPEDPDRQRLRASAEGVRADLEAEVLKVVASLKNDVAIADQQVTSLQDSVAGLEQSIAMVSRASLDLRQLEREADAARGAYELMLSRLSETQSQEQFQFPDARIIERAVQPGAPSSPRTLLFTALGGAAGLSLGLIAILLLEMTTVGFARKSEIERATGLSVMGIIPRGQWQTPRHMLQIMNENPYHSFAEQLRNLRTTLALRQSSSRFQTVLISSSVPGEGKSTTAMALANIEAQSGKSCILVDFDTRRSSLATDLGYVPGKGDLASVLDGYTALEDAIQQPEGLTFSLLTTLQAEPGLVDELQSGKLDALFEALKARFQTIVIDTPPLLVVADTLLISRYADAVVILVRQNSTRRQSLRDALRRLAETSARPTGLVLSMVDPRDVEESYGVRGSYETRP